MSDKRHFTVVEGNKEHGLFVGRTPSSVAKKVVSKLSKGNKVIFELREITQGSKKKTYGPYEGHKKKLKEPRKVGDRVYKYESVVHKVEKKGGKPDSEDYAVNVGTVDPRTFVFSFTPSTRGELRYQIRKESKKTQENGLAKFIIEPITTKRVNRPSDPLKLENFIGTLFDLVGKYLKDDQDKKSLLVAINRSVPDTRIWTKFSEEIKKNLKSFEK